MVQNARLRPSSSLVEAEWLAPRLRSFASAVASIVPDEFPAYVRILHPARGVNGEPLRWADVAAWSGARMHRLVQFHAIERSRSSAMDNASAPWTNPPEPGSLSPHLLTALCEVLAGHTSTKDSCWFCLWDGYGWLYGGSAVSFTPSGDTSNRAGHRTVPPALPPEVLHGPKVSLPYRNYLLFNGPLEAAGELGWTLPWGSFDPQSPNLFWPQDRTWCVASEIDLFCTLVAGSEALAEILVGDVRLEAWRVLPGDPIASDSDEINT
jgi:hypothetical protein